MESLFVRSLALGASTDDTQTLASASRTTADATFAVASGREGVIRVYAASCSALLHEFACIHSRVYTLHYTSFSDSLVTLESDVKGDDDDEEDAETFLCVYHDWRERKMVRGYTLPLGVLESPSSNRKADCVAVCSFTGRVVVAMGSVLNIWQCSHGFFEHVMELKVDMAQRHAFLQVEYVAIHGVYVAFASQTEVRVMEIHVRSSNDVEETKKMDAALDKTLTLDNRVDKQEDGDAVPPDSSQCVEISSFDDLNAFVEVPVSCSAYSTVEADTRREQDEQRIFDEQEQTPMVLGRNEAQQEMWNLAGLVKSQDIRTNQAMSYFIGEEDMFPTLEKLSEREEVQDDEEDLQSAKAAVAAELTRLCVKLSSCFHGSENNDEDRRVETTVCDLFEPIVSESTLHGILPGWVQEYLKTRCLPETPRLRRTLEYLFYQALGLLHQKALIRPQDVLSVYEVFDVQSPDQMPWNLENDLAALVVLLTLPRVSRYVALVFVF
ncbi:Glutamine amidotransferase subunit PdxT [Phytophthora nicotianae]|uniref:Glutamine amidotransferase subunit PdxT n=1 Tax=Phytophthora nicotianae TaxID=4792 RepID=A0A0W8CPP8_PHYNI|nr:Glutamine amidotransferase subunit PdxT [Phytophthora nicotianae]